MTTIETPDASQTIDSALHLIIEAIESNPPAPGAGVEVTFYLPTGIVMGNLEPCWYFDQKLLHYIQTTGIDHSHPTPTEGNCGKHQFVHYPKSPTNGQAVTSTSTIRCACGYPTSTPGPSVVASSASRIFTGRAHHGTAHGYSSRRAAASRVTGETVLDSAGPDCFA